jgi:integrase
VAEIILKRPAKQRGAGRSPKWSLLRKPKGAPAKQLSLPELENINRAYLAGELDYVRAEAQVAALKAALVKQEKGIPHTPVFSADNLTILDQYWKKWRAGRELMDERTAYNELRRAVEAIGTLNLRAASADELQGAIKARGDKQARIVKNVERLLRYLGRDEITLRRHKPEKRHVRYLTLPDFQQLIESMPDSWFKLLCGAAFACGGRAGELFDLQPEDWHEEAGRIFIDSQRRPEGEIRHTKNRRERWAAVIPEMEPLLREWIALATREQLWTPTTSTKLSGMLREACAKKWPLEQRKHLTFHDIRHCYAIHVLKHDPSLSRVADFLGDDEATAKKHYLGFIRDADEIALTRSRLSKKV